MPLPRNARGVGTTLEARFVLRCPANRKPLVSGDGCRFEQRIGPCSTNFAMLWTSAAFLPILRRCESELSVHARTVEISKGTLSGAISGRYPAPRIQPLRRPRTYQGLATDLVLTSGAVLRIVCFLLQTFAVVAETVRPEYTARISLRLSLKISRRASSHCRGRTKSRSQI
jgi:hypothetical protein